MTTLPLTLAAVALGVNPETLRRRIKRGQLPCKRDAAGRYIVDVPDQNGIDESIQMDEPSRHGEKSSTQEPLQPSIQALEERIAELQTDKTWLQGALEREQIANAELRRLLGNAQLQLQAPRQPEQPQQQSPQHPERRSWWQRFVWGP